MKYKYRKGSKYYYKKECSTRVYCSTCKKFFKTDEVIFLDIEEGNFGQDILLFGCRECKTNQSSEVTKI
jgi:hypothetical protein